MSFAFLEDGGGGEHIQDIGPDARTTSKPPKANGPSTASLKQQLAAIRMLFDHHLVTGGVPEHNPALSVKVPARCSVRARPPCSAEEAGEL